VAYIHNRVLLNLYKEGIPIICDNIDKSGEHYAKWNKPGTENILHDIHLYVEYITLKSGLLGGEGYRL
jgi:hypothetical protein